MGNRVLIIIGAILLAYYCSRLFLPKGRLLSIFVAPTPTPKPTAIPTATPIPSPTLTPTPTPEPTPVGFCINVPVLFYHHIQPLDQAQTEGHKGSTVAPDIFDTQMKYLNDQGFKTIKAEDLVNALRSHQALGKVAVVTIDDGYADAYQYAYPITRKYNIVLNIMAPTGLMENPGYMSWGNLKDMMNSGSVFVYNHTWSHFSLPAGNDSKLDSEVMVPKKQLEEHFGKTVDIMTYPYGSFDNRVISYLSGKGFIAAFTTLPGQLQCEVYIMALRRTRIGNASLSAYGIR